MMEISVWASRFSIGDAWDDNTAAPLTYRGSHIIPARDGERGGSVDTAHLPGFLTRNGYDDAGDGEDIPWWPFLRLSVSPAQRPDLGAYRRLLDLAQRLDSDDPQLAADVRLAADPGDTVILDVDQVDALIADLTEWRANTGDQQ